MCCIDGKMSRHSTEQETPTLHRLGHAQAQRGVPRPYDVDDNLGLVMIAGPLQLPLQLSDNVET